MPLKMLSKRSESVSNMVSQASGAGSFSERGRPITPFKGRIEGPIALFEQGIDELNRIEVDQVVYTLAETRKLDRNSQL